MVEGSREADQHQSVGRSESCKLMREATVKQASVKEGVFSEGFGTRVAAKEHLCRWSCSESSKLLSSRTRSRRLQVGRGCKLVTPSR